MIRGLLALLAMVTALHSSAVTKTFSGNGSWNTGASWSPSGVPAAADDIIIQAGATCSLNVAAVTCNSLTLNGGSSATSFIINSTNALTVSGAVTISTPSSNSITNTINIGSGSISCASLSLANPGGSNRVCRVEVGSGSLTVSGNVTLSGSSSENAIVISGTGSIRVGGSLSGNTGSFSLASGSTFEYYGSGNQTIMGLTYHHLTCSTGGTKTLGDATTVNGNLVVNSGATINFSSRNITVEGTFTNSGTLSETATGGTNIFKGRITNNGTWSSSVNETYELRGGLTNNGTFGPGSGTFSFTTASQTIEGSSPVTFPVNMTITGAITVTNMINLTITGDLTGTVSGSTFENGAGATVSFGDGVFAGSGTLDADASLNTVNYNRSNAQTIVATTYYHLQKSNAGTATSAGAITVTGNLIVLTGEFDQGNSACTVSGNVSGNGTITMGSGTFTITGTNSHTGTFNRGTGTVVYNGSAQSIPAYTYNMLTLSGSGTKTLAGSITVSSTLTISSGVILALNGNTLTLNAGLSGTGTISGSSASSISIAGSGSFGSNLSMDQTSSSTRTLNNLTVNRSGQTITLGNAMELQGTLTVTAGTLASGGNLTLISTASGDARVATSSGSVTGNVIVQKYLPAGSTRRWIHMGSPVSGLTWSQLIDDILISGPAAGGFDVNGSSYASAFTYTESTAGDCGPNGWAAPTNVSNSVGAGKGMKVFFRGDRNPNRLNWNNGLSMVAVTLDFIGTINSGTQNMGVTYTNNGNSSWDGWNFVSNPYPSAIDWNAASGWTKTNVSGTIYVWNAQSGTYATWNGSSGTNGMSNGRIAMGQGFWIKATAASPTLSMNENVKTSSTATGFFKTNAGPSQNFRMTMVKDTLVWDDVIFNFDNSYQSGFDQEGGDALKLFNSSINLWSRVDDTTDLVINNRAVPAAVDTISLGMTASEEGIYTIAFSTDSLPSELSVLLIDAYRNRTIDVRKEKTWKVLINSEPASYEFGRLKLVFINGAEIKMTVQAVADQVQQSVTVNWNTTAEINTARYEVQHAIDNINFQTIKTEQLGDTVIFEGSTYAFTHTDPAEGMNYYRIKRINQMGGVTYSETVTAELIKQTQTGMQALAAGSIGIYPMPARDVVTMHFPEDMQGDMKMEIINAGGTVMFTQNLSVLSGRQVTCNVSALSSGYYFIRLSGKDGVVVGKLMKQ